MSKAVNEERTFIMVKPDGVQRGLAGEIMNRFERRGFKCLAAQLMQPSEETLKKHYADLSHLPFFPGMIEFMSSGPVFAMVFQGKSAVKTGRMMLGMTNPLESAPGTVRGDFGLDVGRNICHGSDTVENAEREIALWFPNSVLSYNRPLDQFIYE
jgi:nucleoside-diphosphate kinase